jgi:hypothetical protein
VDFPQGPTVASSISFSLRPYMKKLFRHLSMCCFVVVSSLRMADNAPSSIPTNAGELRAFLEWVRMDSPRVNLNRIEGYMVMLDLVSQSRWFTWNESATSELRKFEANSGYSLYNFRQGRHYSRSEKSTNREGSQTGSSVSSSNEGNDPPGGICNRDMCPRMFGDPSCGAGCRCAGWC